MTKIPEGVRARAWRAYALALGHDDNEALDRSAFKAALGVVDSWLTGQESKPTPASAPRPQSDNGDALGQLTARVIGGAAAKVQVADWMVLWDEAGQNRRAFLRAVGATLYGLGLHAGERALAEELDTIARTYQNIADYAVRRAGEHAGTEKGDRWALRAATYEFEAQRIRARHAEIRVALEPGVTPIAVPEGVQVAGMRLTRLDGDGNPTGPSITIGERS